MNKIETISEFDKWIERLKSVKITEKNLSDLKEVFLFSPEKFSSRNGLDEGFTKRFQSDRKTVHRRILDYEKISFLKRRKVNTFDFPFAGDKIKTRICICLKTFGNSEDRKSSDRYRFYETIKYNYAYIKEHFYAKENFIEKLIIFDEKGKQVHISEDEFNEHFSDIRVSLIDDLLKSNE
jgi:hypothetical protein